jgi:uncharacterized membrane protein HdeD (DUF308 family)
MVADMANGPFRAGADVLRRNWGWIVALGVIQIIIGVIGLGAAVTMTVFSVLLFGSLLLVAGVLSAIHAFMEKQWAGFFCDLMTGVLYIVVGAVVVENPLRAAESLTLLVALFLMMGGMFRIVASIAGQFQQWGWVFLNGVVTLALGIMIWRQWPVSGLWVIGTFVGVEMIFYGWSLVMLGLAAKRLPA